MKSLLVICCIVVASFFISSTRASLCETLATKTNGVEKTETILINLWVNASISLYATNPSFGEFFATINDTSRAAHVSFYGSLFGCTELPAPTSDSMSAVHSTSTISAADFDSYVELTREALQTAVISATVAEMTEFYQIFESFRQFNSSKTICNQAGCQTPVLAIALNGTGPLSFNKTYVATSASTLTVDNLAPVDAELWYVPAAAVDCIAKVQLGPIVPNGLDQTLDLPFTASGVYYIFDVDNNECFVNTTDVNENVLVVDFTFVPPAPVPVPEAPVSPPVTAPVEAPVEPPVQPPVQPPVEAPVTAPVEAPVEPPVQPPVQSPVEAPVTTPVEPPATPIAEQPVQVPVAEVPVAAPVAAPVDNITPATAEPAFRAGGYIAAVVILVLIVVGLVIAVIVMGVKLRRNSTVIVA